MGPTCPTRDPLTSLTPTPYVMLANRDPPLGADIIQNNLEAQNVLLKAAETMAAGNKSVKCRPTHFREQVFMALPDFIFFPKYSYSTIFSCRKYNSNCSSFISHAGQKKTPRLPELPRGLIFRTYSSLTSVQIIRSDGSR